MGVEIRGMDRLRRKVKMLPSLVKEAAVDATNEVADTAHGYAVQELQSSIKYPTSEMARSVQIESATIFQDVIKASIYTLKQSYIFREFGTGPVGEASPKDLPPGITPVYTQDKWFFPTSSVDRDLNALYGMLIVSIKEVEFYMTRGQPARPWLYPALKEAAEDAEEIYIENINRKLKEGLK